MPDWLPYLEIAVPASAADVQNAVRLARLPVPADVQMLLTQHQGEAPRQDSIGLPNGGGTPFGPILVVAPTEPDTSDHTYSVRFAVEALTEWSPAVDGKSHFFPFASNTASGWFCLDQRDPAQPVVFIDLDYGPEHRSAITPLAATATELLTRLRE